MIMQWYECGMSTPNFRLLDLNLLRVFDQVMAERNLTRAAANLAMTQPAVSNALTRLRGWLVWQSIVTAAVADWPALWAQLGRYAPDGAPAARDAAAQEWAQWLAARRSGSPP